MEDEHDYKTIIEEKDEEISELKEKVSELEDSAERFYQALDQISDITRKIL
jgi:HAMP domain-containing protein